MANTLTTVTESMLQDEVLPALKLGLSPLNAMSLQIAESPVSVGDSVTVPIVSAKTAGAYSTTFEEEEEDWRQHHRGHIRDHDGSPLLKLVRQSQS